MSQGNEAFPPEKDAAPANKTETSALTDSVGESSKDDAAADRSAEKDDSASSEDSDATAGHEDDSTDSSSRESTPPKRSSKDRKGTRRHARDEDEDDLVAPPETEEAINVPKMQTVYMLGAMSALTIVLWFSAKLTCNVHPDQVRPPKHFSTKDLAADPKNAAFEFQQRFEVGDYITALDLSTGDMRRIVEAKLKECEEHADECVANQKKLADTVESTGKLLERTDNRASVELTSVYRNQSGSKVFAFDVVKDGDYWRVASRRESAAKPMAPAAPIPQKPAAEAAGAATANAQPAVPMESPEQSAN